MRKEKNQIISIIDIISLFIRNLKIPLEKCVEIINNFSKVAEYRINLHKSIAFLSTNKHTEVIIDSSIHNNFKNPFKNSNQQSERQL